MIQSREEQFDKTSCNLLVLDNQRRLMNQPACNEQTGSQIGPDVATAACQTCANTKQHELHLRTRASAAACGSEKCLANMICAMLWTSTEPENKARHSQRGRAGHPHMCVACEVTKYTWILSEPPCKEVLFLEHHLRKQLAHAQSFSICSATTVSDS